MRMSGTQKLVKFDPDEPGTRDRAKALSLTTPISEISLATLAAAMPSNPPPPTVASGRAADREPAVEQLRTRLARKFTTLADEVTVAFDDFQIGAGAWRPELMAPEGMSTSGGKQASQHLRLRPMRQDHAVLVGGLVNPVDKSAELRDYDHMVAQQHARFGADTLLGITEAEWEQFLRRAEQVLRGRGITTARTPASRELRMMASKRSGMSSRKLALIGLSLVGPLALLVAWRVLVVLLR